MLGCTCIPILVFYGFLFNCMAAGQTSDSKKKLTKTFIEGLVPDACLWLGPPWLNLSFSLALTIYGSFAILFHFSVMMHSIS